MQRIHPVLLAALLVSSTFAQFADAQNTVRPLSYTVRVPDPSSKTLAIELPVPANGRDSIILMMPIWSPGMYALQSYGDRVTEFSAKAPNGEVLAFTKSTGSRWIVQTGRRATI